MNNSRRIFYFCHDYPAPSGGVKILYAHVEQLQRHGYPAYIVHNRQGFQLPWCDIAVPTLFMADGGLDLQGDDIAVIPEDYSDIFLALQHAPIDKYVFCQNHFFIFHGLPEGETWPSLGITGVFCSSQVIANFIQTVFGYPQVPVIPCQVEPDLFQAQSKQLQIAYMPRKRKFEVKVIQGLFCQLYPQFAAIPWVSIDGMTEGQTAAVLGESAVFLALGRFEGLGLPPLEAMLCHCLVVGFHGEGGLEYATAENGFWVAEADLIGCAHQLGEAIAGLTNQDPGIQRMIEHGVVTAQQYSPEQQEAKLLSFWSYVLDGISANSFSPIPNPPLG